MKHENDDLRLSIVRAVPYIAFAQIMLPPVKFVIFDNSATPVKCNINYDQL